MREVQYNELEDNKIYIVPRLFPGYKQSHIERHGCLYDLCRYSRKHQVRCVGKMTYFYVIDSDARDKYPPYELWSTSCRKSAFISGKKVLYHTIDITDVYANKIQQWCKNQTKKRVGKFIAHMLFKYMVRPGTGWLYKRHMRSFYTLNE